MTLSYRTESGKDKIIYVPVTDSRENLNRERINLRNISGNQTILRIIGNRPPMENAVRVQPTLEDLYLFYFKGGCEE